MARREKKPEEPPPGLPPWMATFSDMVTLMLTFFVMLTAMANFEDVGKVDAVIKSIKEALGVGGFDVQLVSDQLPTYSDSPRKDQTIQPVVVKLRQAMAEHVSDDVVSMSQNPNEVRIRLDEHVFFKPGSSKLHPAAFALVADMAHVLAVEDVEVRVEGYADSTGDESRNWTLSSERALAVVLALRQKGPVPGDRLEAAAMGAFRPGADIQENADWNRRIEIVLRGDGTGAAAAASALTEGSDG